MHLDPFWHAAARLAGRLDLSPARSLLGDGPPSAHDLAAAGLPPDHVQALCTGRPRDVDGAALTLADPAYPAALAPLPHAPAVLFLRGDPALLAEPGVAIVGSRRCTATGRRLAARLARSVVERGGVVVSGLAHGIDHAAQDAVPGRTVAVLGQGLGRPLSATQQRLADRILDAGGLLLTEFLPEVAARRWTFPQRNRIIAGLSRATVVVEATRRSGALITARQALAAGREVLAVPGSPLAPASTGCLDLLADGAVLVRDGDDLAHLLPDAPPPRDRLPPGLPDAMADALAGGADLDQLVRATGWSAPDVARAVAGLEVTGVVRRLPGERFALATPDPPCPSPAPRSST